MVGVTPRWQCVLVAWGDRYPVRDINRLVAAIRAGSAGLMRATLLSDRDRPGLDAGIDPRPIPAWFLQDEFRGPGCQTKLCVFDPGALPGDVPAIFLDLDTIVLGDVARILDLLDTPQAVAILPGPVLPFGAVARILYRLTGRRRYARGNSSVVAFHPAHAGHIACSFRDLHARHGGLKLRLMIADERFISWAAQPTCGRCRRAWWSSSRPNSCSRGAGWRRCAARCRGSGAGARGWWR